MNKIFIWNLVYTNWAWNPFPTCQLPSSLSPLFFYDRFRETIWIPLDNVCVRNVVRLINKSKLPPIASFMNTNAHRTHPCHTNKMPLETWKSHTRISRTTYHAKPLLILHSTQFNRRENGKDNGWGAGDKENGGQDIATKFQGAMDWTVYTCYPSNYASRDRTLEIEKAHTKIQPSRILHPKWKQLTNFPGIRWIRVIICLRLGYHALVVSSRFLWKSAKGL